MLIGNGWIYELDPYEKTWIKWEREFSDVGDFTHNKVIRVNTDIIKCTSKEV